MVLPAYPAQRRAHRPVERPLANMVDLFFHRASERNHTHSDANQVFAGELAFLESRLGQCRDYALLDFRSRPVLGEPNQLGQVKFGGIYSATAQVNPEYV